MHGPLVQREAERHVAYFLYPQKALFEELSSHSELASRVALLHPRFAFAKLSSAANAQPKVAFPLSISLSSPLTCLRSELSKRCISAFLIMQKRIESFVRSCNLLSAALDPSPRS